MLRCDAVFEGGGVKGIGLVGAVKALEEAGYVFENLAGTSAGSIISALLAVGYSAAEIETELANVDYRKFRQEDCLDKFGPPGKFVGLVSSFGIYNADYFESWLQDLLERKSKTTFGQIIRPGFTAQKYKYKFQAIASDVTSNKMLVLPGALADFGLDPDGFSIARAVRMSMSIPFYFEPCKLTDKAGMQHLLVDGGMLSNYPIWLLDRKTPNPPWPTFGIKFDDDQKNSETADSKNPVPDAKTRDSQGSLIRYVASLVTTMINAHDQFHISESKGDYARTILIPTSVRTAAGNVKVSTTDFDITREMSDGLLNNGYVAAKSFLRTWSFEAWKAKYRRGRGPGAG